MTSEMEQRMADAEETEAANKENAEISKKYLTFVSDGLRFAICADYVIEIITDHNITHLPKTPDFIKGIINLRGQIIPIMDVRLRLNREQGDYGREACVIVVSIAEISIGLLVDSVSQMVDVLESHISPPPLHSETDMLSGVIRLDGVVYLMLDCNLLLGRGQAAVTL